MKQPALSVYLVDDHPVVEAGLRLGFEVSGRFALVGASLDTADALDRLPSLKPAVVLCDLVLGGEADLTRVGLYREAAPGARIVAFSSLDPALYEPRVRAEGADGFIPKSVPPHEIAGALDAILAAPRVGRTPATAPDAHLLAALDGHRLTPRELDVARRLAHGASIAEVAQGLGISKKTAAIHRDKLKLKLSCPTSSILIATLARMGGLASPR